MASTRFLLTQQNRIHRGRKNPPEVYSCACQPSVSPLFFTWKIVNAYIGTSEGFTCYPENPGNYAIYLSNILNPNNFKLIYIGTTNNLYKRLIKHEVIRTARCFFNNEYNCIYVKCKIIFDERLRKYCEQRIINRLNPEANYAKTIY